MHDLIPPAVWMPALKEATDAWHRRAEAVVPVMHPALTLAGYRSVLVGMHDVTAALEAQIATQRDALDAQLPELRLDLREKLGALDADLAWLDARLVEAHDTGVPVPARGGWQPTTRVDGIAAALGVLYVLEGGTLGGQIIQRHLANRFGLAPDAGVSFYAGYRFATGPMWKQFKQQVEWYGAAHMDELPRATSAAVDAFRDLTTRFEHAR